MRVVDAMNVGLAPNDKYEQVTRDKALETLAIYVNNQLDIEAKEEAKAMLDKLEVDKPRVLKAIIAIVNRDIQCANRS